MLLDQDMQFRLLDHNDLDALVRLEQRIFSLPWSREQYARLIDSGVCRVFGLFKGEELVTYVSVAMMLGADEFEIYNVATAPDLRETGYARFLLNQTLLAASTLGMERAILEVRENNTPALRLYESLGFTPCGRRKGYYSAPTEDAIVYEYRMKHSMQLSDRFSHSEQ